MTFHLSRPGCGDVSGGLLVSAPFNLSRLVAQCSPRCSRRSIWAPQGGAVRGYDTPLFAPRLRGCLRRFAGFGPFNFSRLVVQCSPRCSKRSIWAHQGGAARGHDIKFFAPRLRGCLRRFAGFGPSDFSPLVAQCPPRYSRRGIGAPQGEAARGGDTSSFAPRLRGCLERFACLGWVLNILCSQTRLRGCLERGASFSTPRGSRQGLEHSEIRAQIVGMPRVVCLLGCSTSSAFRADCEDVSALAKEEEGGGESEEEEDAGG